MLSFPAAIKVYLCTVPCDMRRSFDGLSLLAEHVVQCNPLSGHLFVYCNRRTDRLKILYWDHNGFWLYYRRLERGHFRWPSAGSGQTLSITRRQLGWMLDGLALQQSQAHSPVTARRVG